MEAAQEEGEADRIRIMQVTITPTRYSTLSHLDPCTSITSPLHLHPACTCTSCTCTSPLHLPAPLLHLPLAQAEDEILSLQAEVETVFMEREEAGRSAYGFV